MIIDHPSRPFLEPELILILDKTHIYIGHLRLQNRLLLHLDHVRLRDLLAIVGEHFDLSRQDLEKGLVEDAFVAFKVSSSSIELLQLDGLLAEIIVCELLEIIQLLKHFEESFELGLRQADVDLIDDEIDLVDRVFCFDLCI